MKRRWMALWGVADLSCADADCAREEATRARMDAEGVARRTEVVVSKIERTIRRNHIAESVEAAIRPRRKA